MPNYSASDEIAEPLAAVKLMTRVYSRERKVERAFTGITVLLALLFAGGISYFALGAPGSSNHDNNLTQLVAPALAVGASLISTVLSRRQIHMRRKEQEILLLFLNEQQQRRASRGSARDTAERDLAWRALASAVESSLDEKKSERVS